MQIASANHTQCQECGSTEFEIDESDGVVVCKLCHTVVEERLVDRGPEWRSFADNETNPARTGAPLTSTRHDRGLSTEIGRFTDGQGNQLSSSQREWAGRMRWLEEREGTDKHDRTLRFAFGEIDRMTSTLGLPDVVHTEGCEIFRDAKAEDLLPGRSIEAVASSAIALAAKNQTVFRSYEEIASVSRVDVREIERAYLTLNRELSLGIEPVTPLDHFNQVLGRAENVASGDLRCHLGRTARDMLINAQEDNLHIGKNPAAMAAASVYAAVQYVFEDTSPITQKEIGNIVDVSVVTVRNRYTEILDHWEESIEDSIATRTQTETDSAETDTTETDGTETQEVTGRIIG